MRSESVGRSKRLARAQRVLPALLVPLTLLAFPRAARAYWDDLHFQLTYYLARQVGYTPEQAYRLAAADLSTDYDPATEPVQHDDPTEANQTPRFRFHAFRDAFHATGPVIGFGPGTEQLDALVTGQRGVLFEQGVAALNPGSWLHFYQDELPHLGFGSAWGHYPLTAEALQEAQANQLAIGGSVDWFSHAAEDKVYVLAEAWASDLLKYLERVAPEQAAKRGRVPDSATIHLVLARLRAENPAPEPLAGEELVDYKTFYVAHQFQALGLPMPSLPPEREKKFTLHAEGPDLERSGAVVLAAMRTAGMVETSEKGSGLPCYKAARRQFKFDGVGNLVATPRAGVDEFVLAGTLAVKVSASLSSPDGRPVDVTVKLAPTMTGEQEVALVTKAGIAPGSSVDIEHLPVGELVAEASRDGRRLARREGIRLREQRREVTVGNPCFELADRQPMVGWQESARTEGSWKLDPSSPSVTPEDPNGQSELIHGYELRSLPHAGKIALRFDENLPPAPKRADITFTEAQVIAKTTESGPPGGPARSYTFTFDLPTPPPREICDGDHIEIPLSGRAQRVGEPDSGSPSSAKLELFDYLKVVVPPAPTVSLGGTLNQPFVPSSSTTAKLDGPFDNVHEQAFLDYQFQVALGITVGLVYFYDPPATQAGGSSPGAPSPPSPPGSSGSGAPGPSPAPSGGAGPTPSPAFFRLEVPPSPAGPGAASPSARAGTAPASCEWVTPAGLPARAAAYGCPLMPALDMRSPAGSEGTWVRFEGRALVLHRSGSLAGRSFEVRGKALALYQQLGGPESWLGLPIAEPVTSGAEERVEFEGGAIVSAAGAEDAKAIPRRAP